jgi:hypothetical protein
MSEKIILYAQTLTSRLGRIGRAQTTQQTILSLELYAERRKFETITGVNRWDEKAGLRRDAVRSQVIDVL